MQTSITEPSPKSVRPGPASAVENGLTIAGGIWLVLGLFIDGYAHAEIIDTATEDFFTPWHAVFYSGFLFTSAVVGWIASRRANPDPMRTWLPPGYGLAAVGIAVFAVGGLGDGVWHTIFGIESGIDALLSPTHLFLLTGMALILTAPFRALWHSDVQEPTWSATGAAVASIAFTTALVAFFFTYAFGLAENGSQGEPFDPVSEAGEEFVELGLSTAYVATVILVVPLLALLRRTDLPAGAVTIVWTVPVMLEHLAFGGTRIAIVSALVGGVVVEAALAMLRGPLGRRRAVIAAVGTGVTAMWALWIALTARTSGGEGVAWQAELWSGQIVMCGLVAVTLGALVFPPLLGREPELAGDR